MTRVLLVLLLLSGAAIAQPAPSQIDGAWYPNADCGAVTYSGSGQKAMTVDSQGRLCGSFTGSLTPAPEAPVAIVPSTALESSHVLKASAGSILSLVATSSVGGYVMLFDATSAPADGAVVPKYCWSVPISGPWQYPAPFATGITVVFSIGANCATKTASATAWFTGQVQ